MKKFIKFIFIFLIFILLLLLYSRYISVSGLITKEYVIYNNKIDNLKIVHFSDLHYLRDGNIKKINKMIKEINYINPDLVVFTGNLIDKDYSFNGDDKKNLILLLKEIKSKYGKYAVIGNHDKKNIDIVKDIYINSNFKLLDNDFEYVKINDKDSILLGGVNTFTDKSADINKIMKDKESDNSYKIILSHEPDYVDYINENYSVELILSGNSHNGQINIPFIKKAFLPKGSKKYYNNYYKVNKTDLYISSGIGEEEFNLRLFNKPSINFYRINKITD